MAWHLNRRKAIVGMALASIFAPTGARALLPAASQPFILGLDVFDVGGFDPIVRRDADGNIARHNLVFRTRPEATQRGIALFDDITRVLLAELTLRWEPSAGPQSLTMYDARVLEYSYVALHEQGRGQNYDEFIVAVESTHGTLRRREAQQTLVADYRITAQGGVVWNRYTA
jgi:hypothetical protein